MWGRRAGSALAREPKKAVGLVSGHDVVLGDPGQVTLLPCSLACVVGMSVSADLMAL